MSPRRPFIFAILLACALPAFPQPAAQPKEVKSHWSFQPVRNILPPKVNDSSWLRTPIDQFILAKLQQNNLHPTPPADKRTLIRRVYYDLIGLPPTFDEVTAFEKDTSPDAYEKVVDHLLASPRYGERWGRYWLDLARYADTKGYVYSDREDPRFVGSHNYRDWVIRAFNQDTSYDRFVKLQIAADQTNCPQADLAAMGFLTVGRRFLGVNHDIIDDRIDVVTRTMQGLSVACARCHDHKFDPIPTQDYYSLYGVFDASTEKLLPLEGEPNEKSPQYVAYRAELKKRTDKLNEVFTKKCEEVADRARVRSVRYLQAVLEVEKLPDELFYINRDGDDVYPVMVQQWQRYILAQSAGWSRVWGPWNELARIPSQQFAADSPFAIRRFLEERLRYTNRHVIQALAQAPPASMRDVAAIYGKLLVEADRQWKEQLKADPKAAYLIDGDWEELRQELYALDSPARTPKGSVADIEFFFDEGTRVVLDKAQMEIEKWQIDAPGATPQAMVLQDRPLPNNPRVFRRGNPMNRGEEVPRRYLEVIAGPNRKPFTQGSGRLEMADAIANKDNPLTARVMVNRIWQWHFGAGLVATPSDFGMRCDLPSHPELLDWLARQFMDNGWSVKAMHRLILLSSTYRQGSDDNQAALSIDPENRLLWRVTAQRLSLEEMRDSLLAVDGDLDLTAGGRPVELFKAPFSKRRAVYGRVDRQFLPGVLRVFDFANPDLHSPQRAITTVPQQALFMMNSPFVIERACALAANKQLASIPIPAARIARLYQIIYQRNPTPAETSFGIDYLNQAASEPKPADPPPISTAWQYGYGELDPVAARMKNFTKLPHFTGTAWQGGSSWPNAKLGWAQLTAEGGHTGDDFQHAVIRRWISPIDGVVSITGTLAHNHPEGQGIIARIISSRQGQLHEWTLHNKKGKTDIQAIEVKKGDTIDFFVSIAQTLNNNDFLWSPTIKSATDLKQTWNAKNDFAGPFTAPKPLTPWESYAQALLLANEFVFVD